MQRMACLSDMVWSTKQPPSDMPPYVTLQRMAEREADLLRNMLDQNVADLSFPDRLFCWLVEEEEAVWRLEIINTEQRQWQTLSPPSMGTITSQEGNLKRSLGESVQQQQPTKMTTTKVKVKEEEDDEAIVTMMMDEEEKDSHSVLVASTRIGRWIEELKQRELHYESQWFAFMIASQSRHHFGP